MKNNSTAVLVLLVPAVPVLESTAVLPTSGLDYR